MPFTFHELSVPGVILIQPRIFPDERGFFMESFRTSDFRKAGIHEQFVQDNISFSQRNVIRGLHFQLAPASQGKLVQVICGRVFDVAVDIRRQSPTLLRWVTYELSEENHAMLYIPPGFAHGFAALSDTVKFLYKCTEEFSPQHESGIRWDDPDIGIPWPIKTPNISEKDMLLPYARKVLNL